MSSTTYSDYFDYLRLYNERKDLLNELQWAQQLESRSKTTVGLKRIQRIREEIAELTKKKRIIEPQYSFQKNNEVEYKNTLKELQDENRRVNKIYITQTSQINKLKRQIDTQTPKSDMYEEKLEELMEKPSSADYKRISSKLNTVNTVIKKCKQEARSSTDLS